MFVTSHQRSENTQPYQNLKIWKMPNHKRPRLNFAAVTCTPGKKSLTWPPDVSSILRHVYPSTSTVKPEYSKQDPFLSNFKTGLLRPAERKPNETKVVKISTKNKGMKPWVKYICPVHVGFIFGHFADKQVFDLKKTAISHDFMSVSAQYKRTNQKVSNDEWHGFQLENLFSSHAERTQRQIFEFHNVRPHSHTGVETEEKWVSKSLDNPEKGKEMDAKCNLFWMQISVAKLETNRFLITTESCLFFPQLC